ncbi:MAG: cyclodeaminase/cyclohydrolase family protein [Clostridioides sp.]|jgi:formiminotetrahydrofolate cyclodeaminase|nr:cyclodeaminase/cyclohydrolase family protein [Clostridioides sp.]
MNKIASKSCIEFINVLSSKESVPGGGGAAALVGATGTALCSMVDQLTRGKKKFIQYDEELRVILEKAEVLQNKFIEMIDADAENFIPLSEAYKLPSSTEEEKSYKDKVMEEALRQACTVPVNLVRLSYEAIKLHEQIVDKCSMVVISDVAVGVQCLRSALLSAKVCVTINTSSMKDREYVNRIDEEVENFVTVGVRICDEVYEKVVKALG